jgi:hypothetical protein
MPALEPVMSAVRPVKSNMLCTLCKGISIIERGFIEPAHDGRTLHIHGLQCVRPEHAL